MKIDYSSDARWPNAIGHTHDIELNLDLAVSDFIKSKNVAVELTLREQKFRREIHQLVVAQVVPKIIADAGINGDLPEGHLTTNWDIDSESSRSVEKPQQPNESLTVRSKLHMVLSLTSSRPVNAMQALYNSRAGIAASIADDIMAALKFTYLGVTSTKTDTKSHLSGDEVTDFSARTKTDFQGQN